MANLQSGTLFLRGGGEKELSPHRLPHGLIHLSKFVAVQFSINEWHKN